MTQATAKLYDRFLEPLLYRWKSHVSEWIANESPGLTLDICCGTGKQCQLIAAHSPVIGLDLDLNMLKYAKSVAPEIPFVCADAKFLPFKTATFKNANISLALHDKPEVLRKKIVNQTEYLLQSNGHFFIIDFEQPYSTKSKIGYFFIYLIEFMAGREHFLNGREFVKTGGQRAFSQRHRLRSAKTHHSQWGSSSISMYQFGS